MLNRPEKRNAMSPELHAEMDDALARMEFDDDVRCLVVCGAGQLQRRQDLKKFFRELENKPFEQRKARDSRTAGVGTPVGLRQADDRDGRRLLRGRRVHAVDRLRLRHRRRRCDVLALRSKLGHFAGRTRCQTVADALLPRHAMYYASVGESFDGKEAERIGLINFAYPKTKCARKRSNSPVN